MTRVSKIDRPRVLMVHDSPDIMTFFDDRARAEGLDSWVSDESEKTHEMVASFKPHVVVLDWQLGPHRLDITKLNWGTEAVRHFLRPYFQDRERFWRAYSAGEFDKYDARAIIEKALSSEKYNGLKLASKILRDNPNIMVMVMSKAHEELLRDGHALVEKYPGRLVLGPVSKLRDYEFYRKELAPEVRRVSTLRR